MVIIVGDAVQKWMEKGNKMRDRLIELILECSTYTPEYSEQARLHAEYLAQHLLNAGAILPPCKVGDTVYYYLHPWREEDGIAPYQITNITITQNKQGVWTKKYRAMQILNGKTIDHQLNFAFDEIGKTVFLTREEAEKALAERGENGT